MLKNKNIQVLFIFLSILFFTLYFVGKLNGWFIVLALFIWLILIVWGAFDIRSSYFIKSYCKADCFEKKIILTFDDGPTLYTNNILDILFKYNVKATFFCIGNQIEKHPDIFKRIIDEGHLVGNHSFSHNQTFGFWSSLNILEDITKNDSVIKDFLNKRPLFFRPPFGVTNPNIAKAIFKSGHNVIGWNIRSLDTVIEDESKIFNRIIDKIKPGAIVLLHDTSLKTANVLEELLLFLQNQNYIVTPLDELLNLKAYEV